MEVNSSLEEDNRVKTRNYSSSGANHVSDPKVKLMCSYGGKILPRPSDGKLRYAGGDTRMISVSRHIHFVALQQKMTDIYGPHLTLKYQLPEEDLDALVTVSSDEDLENMMEECDRLNLEGSSRLRVFVFSLTDVDNSDLSLADPKLLEQQYVDAVNALQVDAPFRKSDGSGTGYVNSSGSAPPLPPFLASQMFMGINTDGGWDAAQKQENVSPVLENHNFNSFLLDKEFPSGKYPLVYPNGVTGSAAPDLLTMQYLNSAAFVANHNPNNFPTCGTIGGDIREMESGGSASSSSSSQQDSYNQTSNHRWAPNPHTQAYLESMPYGNGKDQLRRSEHQYSTINSALDNKINATDMVHRNISEKPNKLDSIRTTSAEVKKSDLELPEGRPLSPGSLLQRQLQADLISNDPVQTESLHSFMDSGLRHLSSELQRSQDPHMESTMLYDNITPPLAPGTIHQSTQVADPLAFPAVPPNFSPHTCETTDRVDLLPKQMGGQLNYGGSVHNHQNIYSADSSLHETSQVRPQVQIPVTSFPEQKREPDYKFEQPIQSAWLAPDISSHLFPKPGNHFDEEVPDLNSVPKLTDDSGNTNKVMMEHVLSQEVRHNPSDMSLLDQLQYDDNFTSSESGLKADTYHQSVGIKGVVSEMSSFDRSTELLEPDEAISVSVSQAPFMESRTDENISSTSMQDLSIKENLGDRSLHQDIKTSNDLTYQKSIPDSWQVNGDIKHPIEEFIEGDEEPIGEPLPSAHFGVRESYLESWSTTIQSQKGQNVGIPEIKQVKDVSTVVETLSVEDSKSDVEELDTFQSAHDGTIHSTLDYPDRVARTAEEMASKSGLQIIRYPDLEELRELGSGTFGTVYHGKWRGTDVAIKKIKSSCFTGRPSERERLISDFWQEASLLGQLHHPNVVAFYGVVPDGPDGTLATLTEYMVNGSLKQALQKKDRLLDRRKRLLIAMDAAFGMEYLHGRNIVHFDLKCENLLVNLRDVQRPICKVGDLGLSKVKQQTMISGGVRGTLPWMAPELLNGRSSLVSEKVDVFSFGIVLWEILTGEEPYADMHYGAIIGGIVSNTLRPDIPESCDPTYKALMEACWATDPAKRPTFSEIARSLRSMEATVSAKGRGQVPTAG